MTLDDNAQAILLLTTHFSKVRRGEAAPLAPTEYGRLSRWMHDEQRQPKDLLTNLDEIGQRWSDPKGKVTADRLQALLRRGGAMGVALEKWNSAGIWIITRSDPDYPQRLRKKLGRDAPAVLFGVGNRDLLQAGGLAIVGSRNIDAADKEYTRHVARSAALEGLNLVSGGARGVDETAMLGALEIEGTTLGILANGLLAAALAGKWRPHVKSHSACLVSTYYPEAGFNAGNAMGRNKYIYCLADYALAVRADKGKGGTWAGATEALRRGFCPVLVKPDSESPGNVALIEKGATPLDAPPLDVGANDQWLTAALGRVGSQDAPPSASLRQPVAEETSAEPMPRLTDHEQEGSQDLFYSFFVTWLKQRLGETPKVTLKELKGSHPDLIPKQLTEWLSRAVKEGVIERPGRAHRYSLKAGRGTQKDLFESGGSKD